MKAAFFMKRNGATARKHVRYAVNSEGTVYTGNATEQVRVRNISAHGLCGSTDRPLQVNDTMLISLSGKPFEDSVKRKVKVLWSRKNRQHSFEVGMSFIESSPELTDLILRSILPKRLSGFWDRSDSGLSEAPEEDRIERLEQEAAAALQESESSSDAEECAAPVPLALRRSVLIRAGMILLGILAGLVSWHMINHGFGPRSNREQLVLQGISFSKAHGLAVINGEIVEEGDEIAGGMKIRSIEADRVTVSGRGKIRVLRMPAD